MMEILYIFLIVASFCESAVLPGIPTHLRACYQGGGPVIGAPRRLDVYLSLVRKLEQSSQLDMRMLTTAILRSLRLDGVEQSAANAVETEFLLPYRASAFQFHRYKLLMDLFLPSQNLLEVDEQLSLVEKCLLHRMISSTVRQWERGDESVVCPVSAEQRQNMVAEGSGRIHSRCPLEEGAIQTEWGTVAAGTLMAALASALESQRVSVADILNANIFKEDVAEPLMAAALQEWYDDIETLNTTAQAERQQETPDISNIWVATLAGDLAEVVVNQGPRVGSVAQNMAVGSNNRWNDTLLPRNHYLLRSNASVVDWHFTDAEILAGVDGLILSNYIATWVEQRRTLRLSQVIQMYYSNEGVSFDPSVKACNRVTLFADVFKSTDLFTQTSRFAHVLSLRQITVYIPVEEMERITEAAVTAFTNYVNTLLTRNHKNCQKSQSVPVIDLVVATDGAWKGYEVEQFISWIGGALEINLQRSTLGLLHGNTGTFIAPPSNNLTTIFEYMANFTDEWPTRMSLPTIVSSAIQLSLNASVGDIARGASAGPSRVVLVLSPTDRPSAADVERARDLMHTLRASYFDLYFAYAAEDLTPFQNINNEYLDYSEMFITTPSASVQDVIQIVDEHLVKGDIPKRIIGAQCPFNGTEYEQVEYEDYVLPGRESSYRIHPYHLQQQAFIQLQFRNDGQGKLLVCSWRGADTSHSCQAIGEREIHMVNLTAPCPSADFCPPAHLVVTAQETSNLCANNDCRFPHQVGYYIRHTGLRCLPLKGSAALLLPLAKYHLLIIITLLLKAID